MSYNDFYWGPLINPDKSASPLLEQICLGIAQLMTTLHGSGTADLTPERLATFYHKVGGNYDTLFLETKPTALSFIYQSLGCYHSLQQPPNNPFGPPSIPALLPSGFVRWQTIQILLDPDEHSEYIQRAVKIWDVRNPYGGYFSKTIPRDAFPSEPDPDMVQWHEQVSKRLEYDYMKRSKPRASPPNFGHYQYHYMPKNAPPSQQPVKESKENKERAIVTRRAHRTAPVYRYIEADETSMPPSPQPKKDTPHKGSSSLRNNDERKPQAPTPPPSVWPDRGSRRDRADFASPLGPEAMPGYFPTDLSSDDDSSPEPSPAAYRSGRRNLSAPRNSRNRRHSHEAYSRRPVRDLSPEYKRYTRDDYNASASSRRHYESDAPRRKSWMYKDEFTPPPTSSKSHKHSYTFNGPNGPADPDSPICFHVPQYTNGSSHRGYMDPAVAQDSRRRSYSGGHAERAIPVPVSVGQCSRWPNSKKYNIPWAAMQDEYGRRVYER